MKRPVDPQSQASAREGTDDNLAAALCSLHTAVHNPECNRKTDGNYWQCHVYVLHAIFAGTLL